MGGIPGRISGRPRETIRAVGAIAESPAEPGSRPTSGPFVNGPYGETWVSAVGAGVLDSPAGKSEKMQKSPANADFDPFSPEISFRFPLFIDLRLSLHGRGPKGLASRRKPRPYGADGELRSARRDRPAPHKRAGNTRPYAAWAAIPRRDDHWSSADLRPCPTDGRAMLVPTERTDKRVVEGADPYEETQACAFIPSFLHSFIPCSSPFSFT